MKEDNLRDRLEQLCNASDTSNVQAIVNFQNEHLELFRKQYGRFMDQHKMYYSALIGLIHNVNYFDKSKWPKHRALQFTLAAHSQKQLYTSYMLLCNGFYEDSISLIRSAYESFLRILFISCNPKHPYNVFGNKEGGPKFNATNFVVSELKLDWATYNLMSSFAHSNKFDVLEDMITISQQMQKEPITLRFQYDEKKMGVAVNYLQFLMLVYLKLATEVLIADYSSHKDHVSIESTYTQAKEYVTILQRVMETHTESEHWRIVAKDVLDIFTLMHTMEAGNDLDWRIAWRGIRKQA
jgi:hypothetical protein